MKFKPGDVIVWNGNYKTVYLVVEYNTENKHITFFILNSTYKISVGGLKKTYFKNLNDFTNVNDIEIKNLT